MYSLGQVLIDHQLYNTKMSYVKKNRTSSISEEEGKLSTRYQLAPTKLLTIDIVEALGISNNSQLHMAKVVMSHHH